MNDLNDEVTITERTRIKRASATRRHGKIWVSLPRHWSKKLKHEAALELVEKVLQGEKRQQKILQSPEAQGPRITLATLKELQDYVTRINIETFNVLVHNVRIGHSRYTQLAQMNIKTRTMSVSRYCLTDVPESSLRYLIIHELAHCLERGHNARFWGWVQQHVPDYRIQSRLIKAFHSQAVFQAESEEALKKPATKEIKSLNKSSFSPLEWLQEIQMNLF